MCNVTFKSAELTEYVLWSLVDILSRNPFWCCWDDTAFYRCIQDVKGLTGDHGCTGHKRHLLTQLGFCFFSAFTAGLLTSSKSLTQARKILITSLFPTKVQEKCQLENILKAISQSKRSPVSKSVFITRRWKIFQPVQPNIYWLDHFLWPIKKMFYISADWGWI